MVMVVGNCATLGFFNSANPCIGFLGCSFVEGKMTDGITAMMEDDDDGVIPKTYEEVMSEKKPSALDIQIGGTHYKQYPIQPVEYILANGLGFCEGSVVKYVTRWKEKGGIQDLQKAVHFLQILIQKETP